MVKASVFPFIKELVAEIYEVTSTLFKVMIPITLLVKLLDELGGTEYLSYLLTPLMDWVGLPESMGLVWATTLLTNLYTGMLVFFLEAQHQAFTVADVTVLGGMLLIAHSLPIEARVAQLAGVRIAFTLLLRIGGALLFGWLLQQTFHYGDWLQQPNQLIWQPTQTDTSFSAWLFSFLQSLGMVVVIISALLTLLKVLKLLHIERLLIWLLTPLLRCLGISAKATSIIIVGITLGLSYGGGLLIKEAKTGELTKQDIFAAMSFLGLFHSVIEDTLLIMLLGAHISGVLWLRLAFALIVTVLITFWLKRCSQSIYQRYLFNSPAP
ncbi:hypothetical protein [Spartinivicinus poritis]|uniref:Nucleoside recognition protein n=1 Tax=Spartinivicinus poritis TaxID=2994640 RepID=A0ABT5UBZ9_9GAMM|nr:hypothetical protein [Spartinivicinus sp. A2-2]MDE1463901.1 hypothetical protein [Spartinivicinus sp. A2-2]